MAWCSKMIPAGAANEGTRTRERTRPETPTYRHDSLSSRAGNGGNPFLHPALSPRMAFDSAARLISLPWSAGLCEEQTSSPMSSPSGGGSLRTVGRGRPSLRPLSTSWLSATSSWLGTTDAERCCGQPSGRHDEELPGWSRSG
jgi:hypothetical protein